MPTIASATFSRSSIPSRRKTWRVGLRACFGASDEALVRHSQVSRLAGGRLSLSLVGEALLSDRCTHPGERPEPHTLVRLSLYGTGLTLCAVGFLACLMGIH